MKNSNYLHELECNNLKDISINYLHSVYIKHLYDSEARSQMNNKISI